MTLHRQQKCEATNDSETRQVFDENETSNVHSKEFSKLSLWTTLCDDNCNVVTIFLLLGIGGLLKSANYATFKFRAKIKADFYLAQYAKFAIFWHEKKNFQGIRTLDLSASHFSTFEIGGLLKGANYAIFKFSRQNHNWFLSCTVGKISKFWDMKKCFPKVGFEPWTSQPLIYYIK